MSDDKTALALYVHIPFCVRKCHYCDFLSSQASDEAKNRYLDALGQELAYYAQKLDGYEIRTVFIGGGTPTSLSEEQLSLLHEYLHPILQKYGASEIEFTVEANPGTLSQKKADLLYQMGVNRISLGLQSANDKELAMLGRIHSYEDFLESVSYVRTAGITNLNVDIMAELPDQTLESYRDTLEKVIAVQPDHISAYSLIIEEGTPFAEWDKAHRLRLPDEDTEREMDVMTQRLLEANGYERYEISNYARTGRKCQHNIVYWTLGQYLGVGLGASSCFGEERFTNTTTMEDYLSEHPGEHAKDREAMTTKSKMEEFVFLGLRMRKGISLTRFEELFSEKFMKIYGSQVDFFVKNHLLAWDQKHDTIYLTKRGMDVSNQVLAEFLLD